MTPKMKRRAREAASKVPRNGRSKGVVTAEYAMSHGAHKAQWGVTRREPYTETGIKRLKCIRCGGQASHQWQICADNNNYRPICTDCDVKLNNAVLKFMRHPRKNELMFDYLEEL